MADHKFHTSPHQDGQPAIGRLLKNWVDPTRLSWQLEVRTEEYGVGTQRMGELCLTGMSNSDLTCSIVPCFPDEEVDWDDYS